MKHVTVGKAIDWQQWQLDQSVRSIRFQVDKDNDLYALPVVVIDPTMEKVSASANAWQSFALGGHLSVTPSNTGYYEVDLPVGYDIEVDSMNLVITTAGAALDTAEIYGIFIATGTGGSGNAVYLFYPSGVLVGGVVAGLRVAQWIAATPFRISTVGIGAYALYGAIVTTAALGTREADFNVFGRWRKMA